MLKLIELTCVFMFCSFQESIVEKCDVVCASNDKRNSQASEQELKMANYVFYCTFDVGKRRILEEFPDKIDGIKGSLLAFENSFDDYSVGTAKIIWYFVPFPISAIYYYLTTKRFCQHFVNS